MENLRYITRYDGKKGTRNSFRGWRLCITRQKETYVRYFTDREYGSGEEALQAALRVRKVILARLEKGEDFASLSREYRKRPVGR